MKQHHYQATVTWTGNQGTGTSGYKAYSRDHIISAAGKKDIEGSSDPSFRGDKSRYSPEDLLLDAISSCHMLWYLHLCAVNSVIVTNYVDHATAVMNEERDGSGQFSEATLNPVVTVQHESMIAKANALHHEANKLCFIARSVNFPVHHNPTAVAQP
ncbi:MAG: OsmC family protein [Cyclobacteriaceae bacterium]|nr:OsmC family protein [Cyclobacteriaceae bacterium]